MASITIRNLDDSVKKRLRIRAAENGRSMEEEAREILAATMATDTAMRLHSHGTAADLFRAINARFARLGGVDLKPFPDGPVRPPPNLRK
jgi:plasmid stability protein